MRVRRLLMTLLWALPVLYLAIVGAAWAVQRKLIYFPDRLEGEPRLDTAYGAHLVTFPSGDGVRITGLYAPPRDATGPVVLIAHGNAGSLPSWEPMLGDYVGEGVGGLLLDLRGYGWSEGSPSEEGWALDGEAAVEWLRGQGIETRRLVLHGVSIGCGVVLPLAAKHRVRGVVLQSPFSSLASVAKEHFGFLPVGWILRDRYDNLAGAPGVAAAGSWLRCQHALDRLPGCSTRLRPGSRLAPTPRRRLARRGRAAREFLDAGIQLVDPARQRRDLLRGGHAEIVHRALHAGLEDLFELVPGLTGLALHGFDTLLDLLLRALESLQQGFLRGLECATLQFCAFAQQLLEDLRSAGLGARQGTQPGQPDLVS